MLGPRTSALTTETALPGVVLLAVSSSPGTNGLTGSQASHPPEQ
jgi:hypothetical protein